MKIVSGKPSLGFREYWKVLKVLRSGLLAQGKQVENFEKEFSEKFGLKNSVAVNSGTSALHLGILALGIGPDDEVLVPAFTFAASANAIALTGATPIFVDIEEDSFNIDPIDAENKITKKTKAILVVHLFGLSADMERICSLASRHNLEIIEDCAQAHGATYKGKFVGTFGKISAFSFYPTKNMTSGEGGMVCTPMPELSRKVKLLRNQGMEKRYYNEVIGFNNRMTDIHAAIGRVQLARLDRMNKHRQTIARIYTENLRGVTIPKVPSNCTHVYHQFTIRVNANIRNQIVESLNSSGIGAGVYYPVPLYKLPSYNLAISLNVSEKIASEVLSLPIHYEITKAKAKRVALEVNKMVN